ncbi:MAG TPA: hypothetical protein VGF45_10385 [Polyangia bacterium]
MPHRTAGIALLVAALITARPAPAAAAEDPETLIRQGTELRRSGDNVRAHGYFARAYELARTPRTAAQLGLAELALGDHAAAEVHLSEALAGNDAWIQQNRSTLSSNLERARKHLLRAELVGAPSGATATVGTRAPVPLPADGVLWLPAGRTAVRIEAPGHAGTSVEVDGGAGQSKRVELAMSGAAPLAPPPPPADPPGERRLFDGGETTGTLTARPSDRGRGLRIGGLVAGGAGTALAVTGFLVLQKGNGKRDDIEKAAREGTPYDPANGNFRSLQKTGVALLATGGTALAAGVTLDLLGRRADQAPAVSLGVSAVSGERLLALGGRF